ncbi:hypothetical protein [Lysobacter enzymogenes]|uniref:hypothetical protein n=1 Tax=Lysobacter enzymogenes TaxID=69 RepID=UPI001A9757B2|nr:hypothetical protein [Lysobacter enzymogenes]QQP97519.1 hypothetical protein JHW38_05730 [Lysobacter enzymogenes]
MPTAASIIEALQRRLRLSLRRDSPEPGQFPPAWQGWLDAQSARPGAVVGATADAWVAVFAQRPLTSPPRRAPMLNRWQAFAVLWRQQWLPPEPEDRRLRWGAGAISLLWHVLFGGLLIWLMYLQYFATRPEPKGEQVTMIEFVGKGTPEEPGGGSQQPSDQPKPDQPQQNQPQPQPAEPSPPQPAPAEPAPPAQVAVAAPPTPQLQAQLPDVPVRDVPEPQLPPPTVEQPVMVSTPTPDAPQVFLLPPTRKRLDDSVRAPQIQAAQQPLRSLDVPAPVQPPSLQVRQREIALPSVQAQPREVAVRDVPAPAQLPQLQVREVAPKPVAAPQLNANVPQVRVAEIPTPPAPAAATPAPAAPSQAPAATPSASTPASATAANPAAASASPAAPSAPAAGPSATASTAAPPAATAGAGPKPNPAPGTLPTPHRGDDWGESARNRPGGPPGAAPGLYNRDGSPRIADAPGSASPGFPPGTVTEEIKNLDRAGTWLRRKPTDYEPTTLDKYWRPNETLLAEWVRRSIKNVSIPIPGTTKRIQCSVALLMLGGGCGLNDPNLNDQPAEARPPPDVPFKPHLQEDNGSVRPPPGG